MHIGDEMEINKEREAFEKLPMIREKLCWHIWFSGIDNKYDSYLDRVEEDRNFLNGAWMMFQAKATPEGFVLDAPARVGGGVFREGVKWKTVIESAQRLYEHSKDEIKPIVSPSDLLKIASGELVLVKKELSRKSIRLGLKVLQETDDIEKVFGAMIEAQEQSHD